MHEPKPRFLGLVGMPGSGKNICSKYLEEHFRYIAINLGSIVEEELRKRSVEPARKNYRVVAMDLRKREGSAVVVQRAVQSWIPFIEDPRSGTNPDQNKYIFNGIRNIEEIDFLRETYRDEFTIIGLHSSARIRYERLRDRGRVGFDETSYEEFLKADREELETFGIGNALVLADHLIVNEGTVEELYESIDEIISQNVHSDLNR